jgi:hypothetical protein
LATQKIVAAHRPVASVVSGRAKNLRLGMPHIKKFEANTQYNGQ